MELQFIIILIVFAFGASFTQRVTGFGFGIVFMTVIPHVMPSYGEATALTGLLALLNVAITFVKMHRYVEWKKLAIILPAFVVTSFFCVHAVSMIDSHLMRYVLGALLIIASIYFSILNDKIRMKPSVSVQMSMGALSGFMGGFFAMQGPPAVIYFLACTETKKQYIALASGYFIVSNIMMTGFRAMNGLVTPMVMKCLIFGAPAVLAGLWTGGKLQDKLHISTVRKLVYIFLAISGIVMLVSTNVR